MYKKIQFTIYNIFFLCVAFGMLFFVKVTSYADVAHRVTCTQDWTSPNGYHGHVYREWGIPSTSSERRFAFYYLSGQSRYILCSNDSQNITIDTYLIPDLNSNATSGSFVGSFDTFNRLFGVNYYFYVLYNEPSDFYFLTGNNAVYDFDSIPVFLDLEDLDYYLEFGTQPEKPFDETLKLDSFRVYSNGQFNWDFHKVEFNHIAVKPIWSDERILDVEITIFAKDPSFNYNPRNDTYGPTDSGIIKNLDISGLTLHEQKFIVRATPFSQTTRGVSIQYELEFPSTFDQPIGQLIITEPNHYPYSTTIDVSGDDVPIEWTVTQTPIYVYETNNIENYYYGEPVSYPVPEITENTTNNYYEEYINNYYNDYSTVVNNYETNFDIDITDVSSGDIQNTYDDIGNFFKGFGGFVGKLALLFNGLFPFLSPSVSVVLVTMVGIIAVGGVVILFLKVFHIL